MTEQRLQKAKDFLLRAVESLTESNSSVDGQAAGSGSSSASCNTRSQSRSQSLSQSLALSQSRSQSRSPSLPTQHSQSQPASTPRISSVIGERNRLFNFNSKRKAPKMKKQRKLSCWTHDFICLSRTTDFRTPTSLETGELLRAGLGKRQISLLESGDSNEVHSEIIRTFPKLEEGGGYELLRVGDGSGQRNQLLLIPSPPEGYTVNYLKEVLRQAKVYIRPMQRELTLDPLILDTAVVREYT